MTETPAPQDNDKPTPDTGSLGADLRALRKSRKITLTDLAERCGKSVGWLSQVERDISTPEISDLRTFAEIFDVPMSLFLKPAQTEDAESGLIVRAGSRRIIGETSSGLVEELLSPDLTDSFEVVHSTFQPGGSSGEAVIRQTQELAYLISGKLDLWIDGQKFTIKAGDSFRIRAQEFRWANPYRQPAVAVWVISPPVY